MRLGRSHQSPLQFLLFPLKPLLLFCPSPALLLHQTAQQCNTHRHTQRLTHSHAASACANVCTHAGHPHDSTTLRQTDCCIPSVPSSPPNGLRHPAFLTTQSRAHLITDCFPNSSIHQNLLLPTPPLPLPPLQYPLLLLPLLHLLRLLALPLHLGLLLHTTQHEAGRQASRQGGAWP